MPQQELIQSNLASILGLDILKSLSGGGKCKLIELIFILLLSLSFRRLQAELSSENTAEVECQLLEIQVTATVFVDDSKSSLDLFLLRRIANKAKTVKQLIRLQSTIPVEVHVIKQLAKSIDILGNQCFSPAYVKEFID